MRQVKRLVYLLLLNIIVSAITVLVVLKVWESNHPPLSTLGTPAVIVVTSAQSEGQPTTLAQAMPKETRAFNSRPTDTGIIETTPEVDTIVYQVKAGDTLGALANEFNLNISDIMFVNGLTDPDSLYVGQIIHIPTAPLPTITPTSLPTLTASATLRPSATFTQGPSATAPQTQTRQEPRIIIETVIGAGVLINEHVVLQRTGEGELSLAGWRLEDGAGNTYYFPQLTLYKGGMINLNTRGGENTVQDLFWGMTSSIWRAGKSVYLYDAQNELRNSYSIP